MEILNKDSFWECVVGAESRESFEKNIVPDFTFDEAVCDEVVKSFEIVRKLLLYSYFEYDFLDPALTKSLTSMEMAIMLRYKELVGSNWNGNLQNLFYYFDDNGYFEFSRKGLLDALRSMRNSQSHPERSFGGGLGMMKVFSHCVGLINDTYQDLDLRQKRKLEKEEINNFFKQFSAKGGIVRSGDSSSIFYEAGINFIDNVSVKKKYYFFYKLIFRLNSELYQNNPPSRSLFLLEADSFKLNDDNSLELVMANKSLCVFAPIDKTNESKFSGWYAEYKSSRDDNISSLSMDNEIDKQWALARKSIVNAAI